MVNRAQSLPSCQVLSRSATTLLSEPLLSHLLVRSRSATTLLSDPLLSHLLVDLQPFSGTLRSDDLRTIPSSSQTRDVCDQSSTIITSDFVVLSSNSSGRVLVTLVLVKQLTVKRTVSESSRGHCRNRRKRLLLSGHCRNRRKRGPHDSNTNGKFHFSPPSQSLPCFRSS